VGRLLDLVHESLGCRGGFLAWSAANSAQADTNCTKYGHGIGTAVYWFMGGPGVDPGYNAAAPHGWCLKSGGCAAFFGGVSSSSPYALMWQWSGGGGVRNAIGDFDQIDASRQA
jgi:hypothetical protein